VQQDHLRFTKKALPPTRHSNGLHNSDNAWKLSNGGALVEYPGI
jgi:hypothetical protein